MKFVALLLLGLAFVNLFQVIPIEEREGEVLGISTTVSADYAPSNTELITKTSFDQKEETEYETIPFPTQYEDDKELEYGKEKVLQVGDTGLRTLKYLITYWQGEELYRNIISTQIEKPVLEIIAEGKKIIWRELDTDDYGELKYWYKLKVWATKYDGNCVGCRGLTYSGTPVRKGVCAVDPRVIPLGTNFYVEGYGMCRSEDIGGGIKGDMVDLGYENVMEGSWRTGYTNVYLLTSAPE